MVTVTVVNYLLPTYSGSPKPVQGSHNNAQHYTAPKVKVRMKDLGLTQQHREKDCNYHRQLYLPVRTCFVGLWELLQAESSAITVTL